MKFFKNNKRNFINMNELFENRRKLNIFNIGNGKSRKLKDYLFIIEKYLNKKAKINNMPLQQGDIIKTHSDIKSLNNFSGYSAKTDIEEGIAKFADWFIRYYKY